MQLDALAEFTDAELALVYEIAAQRGICADSPDDARRITTYVVWAIDRELFRRNVTRSQVRRQLGKRVLDKIRESTTVAKREDS